MVQEFIILRLGIPRLRQLINHRWRDHAVDIEVFTVERGELDESTHQISTRARRNENKLALVGLFDQQISRRKKLNLVTRRYIGINSLLNIVKNKRANKPAKCSVSGNTSYKFCPIRFKQALLLVQISRDVCNICAGRFCCIFDILLGNIYRRIHNGLRAHGEPGIETTIQCHEGKHRHDNRRHNCDKAEERDQSNMKPRTCCTLAALYEKRDNLAPDHGRHYNEQTPIEQQ